MTGVAEYTRTMLTRSGTDRLPAHLAATYGIEVAGLFELDLGVFQVDRTDGPAWVARVPGGRLGAMLSGLHTLPGAGDAITRSGGAWHHLADGAPRDEIAAAAALLAAAGEDLKGTERAAYESLRQDVAGFDGGDGLPERSSTPTSYCPTPSPRPTAGW